MNMTVKAKVNVKSARLEKDKHETHFVANYDKQLNTTVTTNRVKNQNFKNVYPVE